MNYKLEIMKVGYLRHLETKKERLNELRDKRISSNITKSEEYMKLANAILAKKRHDSRIRVNRLIYRNK